jgi:uncharacterized protein YndB with AHSA1/START domain
MQFVITRELHAPREAVFDVIADPRRRIEWQSSLREVHVADEGPPRLGTCWYEVTRGGLRFDLQITEFERPLRWAERGQGRIADAKLTVRLEAEPGAPSTLVIVEAEVDFKRGLHLVAPVVRVLMPAALRADLGRVEKLAQAARP